MTNIFIANLDWEITSSDLQATFSAFGEVHLAHVVFDAKTKKSKGFGYVEMVSAEEAIKAIQALNGFEVNGRKLDVKIASPKANRPKPEDKPKMMKKPFNKSGGGGFGGQKRYNSGGGGGNRPNNGGGGYRSGGNSGGGGYRSSEGGGGYRSSEGGGGYRSSEGGGNYRSSEGGGNYRSSEGGSYRPDNRDENRSSSSDSDRPKRPRKPIE